MIGLQDKRSLMKGRLHVFSPVPDHVIGLQHERSLMKANVLDSVLAKGRSCVHVFLDK